MVTTSDGLPGAHVLDGRRDGEASTASPFEALTSRIEGSSGLDAVAALFDRATRVVAPTSAVRDILTGRWMGHALHPLLTDLPIGFWTSASVLDLAGGRSSRRGADLLVGLGVASAVPTAVTGLAEWLQLDATARRVGVVHANANSVGIALYSLSLAARLRGKRGQGVALALAGAAAATVGGYLGGHLAIGRKVGTSAPTFGRARSRTHD